MKTRQYKPSGHLNKICFVCHFKGRLTKKISGRHWREHIRSRHDNFTPPHAIVKNCKFYDNVLLDYCVEVIPQERAIPNEECSTDIPPVKRNAPDGIS